MLSPNAFSWQWTFIGPGRGRPCQKSPGFTCTLQGCCTYTYFRVVKFSDIDLHCRFAALQALRWNEGKFAIAIYLPFTFTFLQQAQVLQGENSHNHISDLLNFLTLTQYFKQFKLSAENEGKLSNLFTIHFQLLAIGPSFSKIFWHWPNTSNISSFVVKMKEILPFQFVLPFTFTFFFNHQWSFLFW